MISANNIHVEFSGIDLFTDISFVINPRDRIGLVGKNGVGKSTLLKILAGKQQPTSGNIAFEPGATVGYLPQEMHIASDKSIYDEALTVFAELHQIEAEIAEISTQLETRTDYESDSYADLIQKVTDMHERFDMLGGNKMEGEVEKVLKGLGFSQEDLSRPMSEFSGGWQMRVELAKLLIQQPTLMLLDEPTNHLDIDSIIWLEEFFKSYPGAIMMVSHDRMFLDNITNRTIEIVFGKTYDYQVNYSKYFELREERLDHQRAAYENQQKYIAQQERFIERFKAKATKAKQAQSKMKQLEKLDRIEFDELDTSSIQFSFPPAPRSGDVVLRLEDVRKSYGDKEVLKGVSLEIERGEKISFVGKNGQGKTTLVKTITGEENHNGKLTVGHNVEIGYYAQIQEKTLNENQTVLETIEHCATGEMAKEHKIRGLLGAFLFGEDDVTKKVKVLSGGEKSRLALAKLLLEPVNLLILDEPTNHLDIQSKEVLKNALQRYEGALILVSHDRDFLKGLTEMTYEFQDGKVKQHIGNIDNFLSHHQAESFRDFEKEKKVVQQQKKVESSSNQKKQYIQSKEEKKAIQNLKKSLSRFEKKIAECETEIEKIEMQLNDPEFFTDGQPDKDLYFKHSELQRKLEDFMKAWEETGVELEAFENGQ